MRHRILGFAALVGCLASFGTTRAAESLCCTHETYICFTAPTPTACGINAAGVDSCDECVAPTPSGSVAPLTIAKAQGSSILLSWDASCVATDSDYAVYGGLLGDFVSHLPLGDGICTTQGMQQIAISPAAGNRYYLVVPLGGEHEGSYGLESGGVPRAPSTLACLPQLVGDCP